MNDSFLEDLELVEVEPKQETRNNAPDRNVTRRCTRLSPLRVCPKLSEGSGGGSIPSDTSARPSSRVSQRRSEGSVDPRNLDVAKPEEPAARRSRTGKKERSGHSVDFAVDNARKSEISSKENERPLTEASRRGSGPATNRRERRGSGDGPPLSDEKLNVLSSIEEIVGRHTRNESTKILRSMQELYIASQANLIKQMMIQERENFIDASDKRLPKIGALVNENARLRNDLERALAEIEAAKRENFALKLRCKELAE